MMISPASHHNSATGIARQSATEILDDLEYFYFGGTTPWIHGATRNTQDTGLTVITMSDPDSEDLDKVKHYTVSAERIKDAFAQARANGLRLCCASDISSYGLGCGCAADLATVIQLACYGRLVFG